MFCTSESTDKIDEALAKAQAEIKTAPKDKDNPFFKSKYADLASVVSACRDALSKNGISVSQWPLHSDDSRMHLMTRLACAGQWMRAEFSIPLSKQDPQGYVSAVTYGKRCALAAAVGVASDDEDDDGNKASGKGENGENGSSKRPADKPKRESKPARDELPDIERPADSYATMLAAYRVASDPQLKAAGPAIKANESLSADQRSILKGVCVIRRIHVSLGGKDSEVYAAARGAAIQENGDRLDWVEAAIKNDERFTEEQREDLLERLAERREFIGKQGAA